MHNKSFLHICLFFIKQEAHPDSVFLSEGEKGNRVMSWIQNELIKPPNIQTKGLLLTLRVVPADSAISQSVRAKSSQKPSRVL